jgi:DNA integrity scanning protein DisA with diadenylate cyclase activity
MSGLRRICKAYGGMTVSSGGKTIHYVWDYANDEPVPDSEMPFGSERHRASERVRYGVGTQGATSSDSPPSGE